MAAADDADVRAMNALRRLVSALRSSGAESSAESGMSIAQRFALRIVGQRPGLTMGDLAAATLTTRSAVSEVVARLVGRGLVAREVDPVDHRRVQLMLTPAGATTCATIGETFPERLVVALNSLDEETRSALATSMEAWIDAAGLGSVAPAMFGEPPARSGGRPDVSESAEHGASHA